jgi:hypothetical protein
MKSSHVSRPQQAFSSSSKPLEKPSQAQKQSSFFQDEGAGESKEENESSTGAQLGSQKSIFPAGSLRKAVSHKEFSKDIMTPEEESDLAKWKILLPITIKDYQNKMELYKGVLGIGSNENVKRTVKVTFKKPTGETYIATPEQIKEMCLSPKAKALKYIEFLCGKARQLCDARDFERAGAEFKEAVNYSIQLNGKNDEKTLKIQLNPTSIK